MDVPKPEQKVVRLPGPDVKQKPRRMPLAFSVADWVQEALAGDPSQKPKLVRKARAKNDRGKGIEE